MYYRLKEPWAFRGWKKTPYAIQAMYGKDKHKKPHFFEKEPFLELLNCNGEEEVNLEDFSPKTQQIVKRMCYFHKHIGEQAVREAADAAILAAGLPLNMKKEEKAEE